MLTIKRLVLLAGGVSLSLSLAACGGTDSTESEGQGQESTPDQVHLWPALSEIESEEPVSEAPAEENQCLSPRQCAYTPESCCSWAAWITGASACPYRCCLPPGYATSTSSNCCTGHAAYQGSQFTCTW